MNENYPEIDRLRSVLGKNKNKRKIYSERSPYGDNKKANR